MSAHHNQCCFPLAFGCERVFQAALRAEKVENAVVDERYLLAHRFYVKSLQYGPLLSLASCSFDVLVFVQHQNESSSLC